MLKDEDSLFGEVNRFQDACILLSDIRDCLLGLENKISEKEIPQLLREISKNEMNLLLLDYTFAYYGLTNQLVNDAQRQDAIRAMKNLKGWEQKKKKDQIEALRVAALGKEYEKDNMKKAMEYYKNALEIDPENPQVLIFLIDAYMKKGDLIKAETYRQEGFKAIVRFDRAKEERSTKEYAEKDIERLRSIFYEKKAEMENLSEKKVEYQQIFKKSDNLLFQVQSIYKEIKRFFLKKEQVIPEDKLVSSLEDVMYIYYDWMSILSGVAYYHLKFKLGDEQLIQDTIEGIRNILGYEKDKDLQEMANSLDSELDSNIWDNREEESVSGKQSLEKFQGGDYSLVEIPLRIKRFGTPSVLDYEDEKLRMKVVKPKDIVIKDEKINILFSYPLSTEVLFPYESKGGFTRLDLYRCIYEGYKQIYDEEENAAGDPGTYQNLMNRRKSEGPYGIWGHYLSELWIERIYYNPKTKTVDLHIGS